MIVYRPLSHIRALSFDLDDTLYDNMPHIHSAEHALSEYICEHYPLASGIAKTQWRDIRLASLKEKPELLNDLGLLRATVLTKGFLMVGMPSHLISAAVIKCFDYFYFKRSDFELPKSVHRVLKKLSKRVPIAAITNGNVNCKAIGIEKYFSCIIQASPSFPMKPNRAMFDHVAATLDIPSKNILHVGDDLDKDIKGAIDAGFQSAWLAVNRPMHLGNEYVSMLPHVQLSELKELSKLVPKR
jgi:HAD superfamily hydrolase (TIGR01509 family)